MLCEFCGNTDAIFHLTDVSSGSRKELHLCNDCFGEARLNEQMENSAMLFKKIVSQIHAETNQNKENIIRCPSCGMTEEEFNLTQIQGCPSCYVYFKTLLQPVNTLKKRWYSGKKPLNYIENINALNMSEKNLSLIEPLLLEEELNKAVVEERYEDAAKFRDRIKMQNAESPAHRI